MSHAHKADKLLIKPAAGARPAPPCRLDSSFPRHATRPVTRRVTSSTETPGWRRPQTDRPAESHSHPRAYIGSNVVERFFNRLNVVRGIGFAILCAPLVAAATSFGRWAGWLSG